MSLIIFVKNNKVEEVLTSEKSTKETFVKMCKKYVPQWSFYSKIYKDACKKEKYCRFKNGFIQVVKLK